MIERDLFSTIRLVRNWGWIGTNGQEKAEEFASEDSAHSPPRYRSRKEQPSTDFV
jgi:predicted DNA-binding WGR domain protein